MKKLKEQYSEYNPKQGNVTSIERDPNLTGIQKFCEFGGKFSGYEIVSHPDTKKEVWGKQRKDGTGINYIYVDDSGNVRLEKRDTQNKVLSNKIWKDCQDVLSVTEAQKGIMDAIISTDKSYVKIFPGAGKVGTGREYTAIDVAQTPQGKESGLFTPGMHFLYKKTGSQNIKSDRISNIEKELNSAGYTLEEPTDETLLRTGRKVSEILGPKYGELYKQKGQPEPTAYKKEVVSDQKRRQCRDNIKNLYKAFKNPSYANRYGFNTASDRINAKDIVHWCKNNMSFVSGALGVGNELDDLFRAGESQGNPFGMRGYNPSSNNPVFVESNKILKNIVRENLIRLSESKKKKILDESKITKKRFASIIENKNINTKKQKNILFDKIITEMYILNDKGFSHKSINEGIFDSISGIFGSAGEGILEMLKEHFAEWIIKTLTPMDPDGWLGKLIKVSFGNLQLNEISKLTNCGYLTGFLAKNIVETIADKGQTKAGLEGGFYDTIRNSLFDAMDKSELGNSIQAGLSNMICGKLPNIENKMAGAAEKLKQGAIQAVSN